MRRKKFATVAALVAIDKSLERFAFDIAGSLAERDVLQSSDDERERERLEFERVIREQAAITIFYRSK